MEIPGGVRQRWVSLQVAREGRRGESNNRSRRKTKTADRREARERRRVNNGYGSWARGSRWRRPLQDRAPPMAPRAAFPTCPNKSRGPRRANSHDRPCTTHNETMGKIKHADVTLFISYNCCCCCLLLVPSVMAERTGGDRRAVAAAAFFRARPKNRLLKTEIPEEMLPSSSQTVRWLKVTVIDSFGRH